LPCMLRHLLIGSKESAGKRARIDQGGSIKGTCRSWTILSVKVGHWSVQIMRKKLGLGLRYRWVIIRKIGRGGKGEREGDCGASTGFGGKG